jgi:hypothetical protein
MIMKRISTGQEEKGRDISTETRFVNGGCDKSEDCTRVK